VVWAAILLTIHNAEEAAALCRIWPRIAVLPEPFASVVARISVAGMVRAMAVIALLGWLLAAALFLRPQWRNGWWLLLALESAMAINAVTHVMSALFVFHRYGPGLVTALTLNAPFAVYCLARARRERWVGERAWRGALLGGVVLHGPVLLGGLWLVGTLRR
jgi:hypothetical protein